MCLFAFSYFLLITYPSRTSLSVRGEIWYLRSPCFCCAGQDDMICMSCTATSLAGHEGHSDGERVCLAAEGFGNRTCFLQSMANKVRFRCLSHFLPARRYASADTSDDPMSDCLCLCLSVHLSVSVTSHIVDSCPLSRFEGGLQQLHTADDSAVHWLETAAKKALAKWNEQVSVLPKRLNESGWFWLDSYLRPILHCVIRKFTHLQKWGYFHLDICSKLWI